MTTSQPFEEKMPPALPAGRCLAAQLREQQEEAAILDTAITANLKDIGYG